MLSRDQQLVQDYLSAGTLLYEALSEPDERLLKASLFALDSAVASFGLCELSVRQAGREVALGVGRSQFDARQSVDRYNVAGLNALADCRTALSDFRSQLDGMEPDGPRDVDHELLSERLDRFADAFRYELSAVELKPHDVDLLQDQLNEVLEVARRGEPEDLLEYIGRKVDELYEVRSSENRGTEENIPWWKVVAVAVFFGITVWALIKCVWRWFRLRCSTNEALVYTLINKAAALGYKLC